jgi:DNA-binding response OmpR family regulator
MEQRILVVDDDDEMREEIAAVMHDEGFSTDTAGDGLAAEKKIVGGNFDLVILDLKLPGMTGFDVLKFIKGKNLKTKVIIITGSMLDDNMPDEKLGDVKQNKKTLKTADYLLNKPFEIKTLIFIIKKLLGREK